MKKSHKVILLVLFTVLISSSVVTLAQGVRQSIEVFFNVVNLEVDGEKVEVDNILYNGTTYAPIRAVAEMLGKEVGWNSNTNTASIYSPMEITVTPDSGIFTNLPAQTNVNPYDPLINLDMSISEGNIAGLSIKHNGDFINFGFEINDTELKLILKNDNEVLSFDSTYNLKIFLEDGRWYSKDFTTDSVPDIKDNGTI